MSRKPSLRDIENLLGAAGVKLDICRYHTAYKEVWFQATVWDDSGKLLSIENASTRNAAARGVFDLWIDYVSCDS